MKVTNGKDVARLLVDEYLNCHPTGHKKFMESMAKEQQEIKDNYTYLGFAWLKGLSEVRYYDLRNEASKLMADDLCLHVKEQPERVRLVYEGAEEMEINPSDEEHGFFQFVQRLPFHPCPVLHQADVLNLAGRPASHSILYFQLQQ